MQFARISVEEARDCLLGHSLSVGGRRYRKGHKITESDIAEFKIFDVKSVWAARLEDGDMPEDVAAARLAQASLGPNIEASAAFTGRANLYAQADGLCVYDGARLSAINKIDEAITIAALPSFERVAKGDMLATIKIIPLAVPASVLTRAEMEARNVITVAPFKPHNVGLVMTRLDDTKETILSKTKNAVTARLEACGSGLIAAHTVNHDELAVAQAIKDLGGDKDCDLILLFGASAIVDRRDVLPAGLIGAGGRIDRFGMPVDPGNLILTGNFNGVPVIAAPGCARSHKRNGFDWVLWRILAGLSVDAQTIAAMGVGGLLKETAQRGLPREEAVRIDTTPLGLEKPRLAALLLAAGQSQRMGKNKLLLPIAGEPMIRHAARAVLDAGFDPLIVVTGHEADAVQNALADLSVTIKQNHAYEEGLSSSLKVGLAALPADCDGFLVMLGDMPLVTSEHLQQLSAAFNPAEGRAIILPTWQGKRGNPVLWARRFAQEMQSLAGDVGAKHLIGMHEDALIEISMQDAAILTDIDTPDLYALYHKP